MLALPHEPGELSADEPVAEARGRLRCERKDERRGERKRMGESCGTEG